MIFSDLIKLIEERVFSKARFYGFYLYRIQRQPDHAMAGGDSDGEVNGEFSTATPVDTSGDLPPMVRIQKVYGVSGLSCINNDPELVLVGFQGGNPNKPFIAFYLPGSKPESTVVQAVETITIDSDQVLVGDSNRKAVARLTDTTNNGQLTFVAASAGPVGSVTLTWLTPAGIPKVLGVIAAPGLVGTPDPTTGGIVPLTGEINSGSAVLYTK